MVKQELAQMGLGYEERLVDDQKHMEKLIELGGKGKVPFLVDEENGILMYESRQIVDYLRIVHGGKKS